ncbi:MAG: NUDIX domain-containing protein [Acidobacteria bacterium]|nr:NUDIX domain-containing protein [Acidobacteriota bacterium]MBI3472683.1 NUDIX domain-containing protein [Candidatus Solibacter usitatus]
MAAGKQSAGLLLYRRREGRLEVFLVHPGGPLFARKDAGFWSIPKGEYEDSEDPLQAALREFREETGFPVEGELHPLTPVVQKSGKRVAAWAVQGDCDPAQMRSNTFSMEWPPRSGRQREFPEVDRGEWFRLPAAREKINAAQAAWLEELLRLEIQ